MIFEFDSNSGLFVARSKGPKKRSGGVRQSPEIGAVSPKYLSDETKIYIFITRIPRVVYIILGGFSKFFFFPTSCWYLQTTALKFSNGIIIDYRRKEVNQSGSAPFAKEWSGRQR